MAWFQSTANGNASYPRLGDHVDSIAAPDRDILETEFGGTKGCAWCRLCERAWPVADLRLDWLPLFDQWGIVCPSFQCGRGLLFEILPYDDLRSTKAPWWPATPREGERLELPAADESTVLSARQTLEALLLAGNEIEAIRAYRAAHPDASLETARRYISQIKRELEKGRSA